MPEIQQARPMPQYRWRDVEVHYYIQNPDINKMNIATYNKGGSTFVYIHSLE
jgi:hypothetical protein